MTKKYLIKSGKLYEEGSERVLAQLKPSLHGIEKQIISQDGTVLYTDIRSLSDGNLTRRNYILYQTKDNLIASGRPEYAAGEDPADAGWPICHVPRMDHASVLFKGQPYELVMQNSQNYQMTDPLGHIALQILHRGIAGGWRAEVKIQLEPGFLLAMFVFCRYLEQENEFITV